MATERDDLLELAARVADGDAVDWDLLTRTESDFVRRRTLERLRVVAAIAAAHGDESMPPEHWGSLQVQSTLGRGAYGTVYAALDPTLDRRVALKLFDREVAADPAVRARLLAEGPRLARVRHPNVVTIYGAAEHDGRLGLWMELIEGHTLRDWVSEHGPLGAAETATIGIELCRALAAVHAAGLLHRDLKADNVIREKGGRIVLMDFGAGVDRAEHGATAPTTGTPLYMAPELLAGSPASTASDTYALGVLLYFLVSGRFPVEAKSVDELQAAHAQGRLTRLRDRRADLPAAFVAVIERALARDPELRYATAGAMEAQLAAALGSSSRRGVSAWLIGIGAVAAVVTASILLRQQAAKPVHVEPVEITPATRAMPLGVSPLSVDAKLLRQSHGAWLTEPLANGGRVVVGDRLQLQLTTREPVHFYLINRDQAGRLFVLFPLAAAAERNPLLPGNVHLLPGAINGVARQWRVDTAGERESFLMIASRRPLENLETAIAALAEPSVHEPMRGTGELVPTTPEPGNAALARSIESLQQARRNDHDLWVEEIVVDNGG
ncbi:MAG: serine/threonine-protein kinase [Acidobacteriota bacterium]